MRRSLVVLSAGCLLAAGLIAPAQPAAAASVPTGFTDSLMASVASPTALAFTPDGRLLIATQPGLLRVVRNGSLLPTPALDLSARICANSERGMLGVVADPDASPGYVYVFWTVKGTSVNCTTGTGVNPSGAPRNRVSRFTLGSGDTIDPATELVLLDGIYSNGGNHNAGDVAIGKDGYLYVSVGDGGCDYAGNSGCGGANDASRDRNVLNGKILRITRTGGIPSSNPFTGSGTARCNTGPAAAGTTCQETFATGLRNPFRFAFDPDASGTSFRINDVGQNAWEEIDQGVAGADYGWNVREGHCANTGSESNCGSTNPAQFTAPIHDYGHSTGCGSITGGAFVPDGVWPAAFDGAYLFGDYVCGKIMMLSGSGTRSDLVTGLGTSSAVHLEFGPYVSAQGAASQALYYTSYAGGGEVRRLAYTGTANRAPSAQVSATPRSGAAPLAVTLSGAGSSDPDGDALTYLWTFGDGGTATTTTATTTHSYAAGRWTASLTVRDSRGLSSAPATISISSGNAAPTATITSPASSALFTVGAGYVLSGSATDPEDGALPSSALTWTIVRVHDQHTHPYLGPVTGNNVSFTAPGPEDLQAAANSRLRIQLTATDSAGVTTTVTRDFNPLTVQVSLASGPSGRQLTVNGTSVTTPATVTSWAGFDLTLDAPTQTDAAGRTYGFDSWSDGGAQTHVVTTPSSATTRTATFSLRGLQAAYYPTEDLSGTTALTRLDPVIDANWGTAAPVSGLPVDDFSVRWSGQVVPRYSQTYTFTATSDDGARLWVNGRLVIDQWVQQGSTAVSGTIALTAGTPYPIVLEYFDTQGAASVRLEWASSSQAREVVPASRLRPAYAVNFQPASAAVPAGYTADAGLVFARRSGLAHGWNVNVSAWAFDRNSSASPDQRYDTLIYPLRVSPAGVWELAVPNGSYRVRLVAGDPSATTYGVQHFTAEGLTVVNGSPSSSARWRDGTATVQVSDGRLTVAAGSSAVNPKLCFAVITLL
jgi:glucose/arabinose dehydrogenase/PKD repeat protein